MASTPGGDLNWLEDIEMLEEDGQQAVFDRYTNAFIKIYFDIPEGRENEYRPQGADQAPAVGQLVRDPAQGAARQVPAAGARPLGRRLEDRRHRLEAARCSRAGSPRSTERARPHDGARAEGHRRVAARRCPRLLLHRDRGRRGRLPALPHARGARHDRAADAARRRARDLRRHGLLVRDRARQSGSQEWVAVDLRHRLPAAGAAGPAALDRDLPARRPHARGGRGADHALGRARPPARGRPRRRSPAAGGSACSGASGSSTS